jgi:hypothetical protein
VKGVAISTALCSNGKCEVNPNNDEVIYDVNKQDGKIVRKAVVNKGLKDGGLAGLQADDTVYTIVSEREVPLLRKDKNEMQWLIKGIGRAGLVDGYETIVIGDDFIHTSRSTNDYFIIYYYSRVKYP